jgi:methionyl-tRNA formyltransferase
MEPLRIVFMGTPEFAVGILDHILQNQYKVVGVITVTDKPAGRGQKVKYSAVKDYALAHNLPLLQPTNLKDETFLAELAALKANLQIVVAFRMLPKVVWGMPQYGTFNLHASLLPDYRGAAPINWAIINGEKETGVSTFFINEEIDAGAIIDQEKITIDADMDAGTLHDSLMQLGAQLTLKTLDQLALGTFKTRLQKSEDILITKEKLAPKIFKEDTKIDWGKSAQEIHNKIRGLSPYPAAWCILRNIEKDIHLQCKLFESTLIDAIPLESKTKMVATKDGILFPCSDHYLTIKSIQLEGKRRMDFKSFLAGNKLEDWELIID